MLGVYGLPPINKEKTGSSIEKMGQKVDQVTKVSIQTDTEYEKVFKASGHQEMRVGTTWGIHRRERVGGWVGGRIAADTGSAGTLIGHWNAWGCGSRCCEVCLPMCVHS